MSRCLYNPLKAPATWLPMREKCRGLWHDPLFCRLWPSELPHAISLRKPSVKVIGIKRQKKYNKSDGEKIFRQLRVRKNEMLNLFFKGMERTQAIMDRMRGGLPFIRSTPSFIVLCVLPVVFDLYPIHVKRIMWNTQVCQGKNE